MVYGIGSYVSSLGTEPPATSTDTSIPDKTAPAGGSTATSTLKGGGWWSMQDVGSSVGYASPVSREYLQSGGKAFVRFDVIPGAFGPSFQATIRYLDLPSGTARVVQRMVEKNKVQELNSSISRWNSSFNVYSQEEVDDRLVAEPAATPPGAGGRSVTRSRSVTRTSSTSNRTMMYVGVGVAALAVLVGVGFWLRRR